MKLKNILIVVNEIERSKKFYHDLFGLDVLLGHDGNVILTEGLVLQDKAIWQSFIGQEVIPRNHASELYFEETNLEQFAEKLERYEMPITYVNRLMEHSWGQRVIRFYDPDGNLIEVGTPMQEWARKEAGDEGMDGRELLDHLERLHTTELGEARIRNNLALTAGDAVAWCREAICSPKAVISRRGKNWYISAEQVHLTVNARSYTIITAHREK